VPGTFLKVHENYLVFSLTKLNNAQQIDTKHKEL